MRRIKLNDNFEFGESLDMAPFLAEEADTSESSETTYSLSGVLVHSGTADSGHYYSFAKDGSRWLQFNDSNVTEFDSNDIKTACFGGLENFAQFERTIPKIYNAYMLFYERNDISTSNSCVVSLPNSQIKSKIAKDNLLFLRDRTLFDVGFYNFIKNLIVDKLRSVNIDTSTLESVLTLASRFYLEIYTHSTEAVKGIDNWTVILTELFTEHIFNCTGILSLFTNKGTLKTFMLECGLLSIRVSFMELVVCLFKNFREKLPDTYGLEHTSYRLRKESKITRLIDSLISHLPASNLSWRIYSEYFNLLYSIANLGEPEILYFLEMGYLEELLEFYLWEYAPTGDNFTKPKNHTLCNLIMLLLRNCDLKSALDGEESAYDEESCVFAAPSTLINSLFREHDSMLYIFYKMSLDGINPGLIEELAILMAKSSTKNIQILLEYFFQTSQYDDNFECFVFSIIKIPDSQQNERSKLAVLSLIKLIKADLTNDEDIFVFFEHAMDELSEIQSFNKAVREFSTDFLIHAVVADTRIVQKLASRIIKRAYHQTGADVSLVLIALVKWFKKVASTTVNDFERSVSRFHHYFELIVSFLNSLDQRLIICDYYSEISCLVKTALEKDHQNSEFMFLLLTLVQRSVEGSHVNCLTLLADDFMSRMLLSLDYLSSMDHSNLLVCFDILRECAIQKNFLSAMLNSDFCDKLNKYIWFNKNTIHSTIWAFYTLLLDSEASTELYFAQDAIAYLVESYPRYGDEKFLCAIEAFTSTKENLDFILAELVDKSLCVVLRNVSFY